MLIYCSKNKTFIINSRIPQFIIILVALLFLDSTLSQAQEFLPNTFVEIKLVGKKKVIGEVILNDKDSLFIRDERLTIVGFSRSDIKRIKRLLPGEIRNGMYLPSTVNADKGTLVQNGLPLAKGEVYVQNNMLVWNEISAGITDRLSARIGFETFTLIDRAIDNQNVDDRNAYNPFFLITAKYSIPVREKYHLGISLTTANEPGSSAFMDYGFLFLSNTIGTRSKNLTIGLGTQLFDGSIRDSNRNGNGFLGNSFLTFSGAARLSPKLSLITEHWLIIVKDRNSSEIDDIPFINSLGIKLHGKRATYMINIARGGDYEDSYDFWVPFPILAIAIPISRNWGS